MVQEMHVTICHNPRCDQICDCGVRLVQDVVHQHVRVSEKVPRFEKELEGEKELDRHQRYEHLLKFLRILLEHVHKISNTSSKHDANACPKNFVEVGVHFRWHALKPFAGCVTSLAGGNKCHV